LIHTISQSNGWIEVAPIIPVANSYLTLMSTFDLDRSYRHIVQFDSSSLVQYLTLGQFNVDKIIKVDKDQNVYFTAPLIHTQNRTLADPAQSHLYKINNKTITCITCDDKHCQYNDILSHDDDSPYFIQSCHNQELNIVPTTSIRAFNERVRSCQLEIHTFLTLPQ
jgi:hypothetical protein